MKFLTLVFASMAAVAMASPLEQRDDCCSCVQWETDKWICIDCKQDPCPVSEETSF